jgi:hypothetical protein
MTSSLLPRIAVACIAVAAGCAIGASSASAYGKLGHGNSAVLTNNVATNPFFLGIAGLDLQYRCKAASSSGISVQVTSNNQRVAFRSFPARCDGFQRSIANIYGSVPVGVVIRARIHSYSANRFLGAIDAYGDGGYP